MYSFFCLGERVFSDSHCDIFMQYKSENEIINYLNGLENIKKLACVYFSHNNSASVDIIKDIQVKFAVTKNYEFTVNAIENAWFVNYKNIDKIVELRPEYVTLTHNDNNLLCGGCNGNDGLTEWGKEVVKILQENNILIDTAHMSKQAFWDFVKINTKSIFNSHTGVKLWSNHKRNLDKEQIKQIKNSGGYIGIALYNEFWGVQSLTAKDIANGILDLIEEYGVNLFGLGTDFFGIENYPLDIKNYKDIVKLRIELDKLKLNQSIIQKFLCDNYLTFV